MPRKYLKNKGAPKRGAPARRRRLNPVKAVKSRFPLAATALKLGIEGYKFYKSKQNQSYLKSKTNYDARLAGTDNITRVPPVIVGRPRKISFQEKVSKTFRPPLMFKRNYAFSSECISGRKGWFSMEINQLNINDLNSDITTYKSQMFTDTSVADSTVASATVHDGARFYVDYHSEKVQMINSSSNAITGKVHLIAHKKDNDNVFASTTTPITPINLMAYYSTNSLPALTAGAGNESTVGNGWAFNTVAGSNTNYAGVYNMPGSSINAAGATLATDPQLSIFSPHIKDRMDFWFKSVSSKTFSLKPGQQINTMYLFHDLPKIFREEQQDFVHVAGVSFSLVVEFQSGIVGSSVVTTGNNVITTGDAQLSVIRESKRILGMENTLKTKTVLQTAPLASVAIESQVIINPDTGVSLIGSIIDP